MRNCEGKRGLLVEYRLCLGVDFATREEDVDRRSKAVWLDTIGPRDIISHTLPAMNLPFLSLSRPVNI